MVISKSPTFSGIGDMLTIYRSTVVVALAAVMISCSGGGGDATITPPVTPVLTTISLSGGTTVVVGSTLTLIASPRDQNGNAIAATVSWSSSATNVATVSSSGVVLGVAPGSTIITSTAGSVTANTTITVTAVPILTSMTISGGTTLVAGTTLQLAAAPKDQNGAAFVTTIAWSSNASTVASVNSAGLIMGITAGTAIITASSGSVAATVTVTVAAPVLTSITIGGGASVVAGQTIQLTASPKDQAGNAFTAAVTWTSAATSIATVNAAGLVSGVAVGTAVITAASGSVTATKTITVTAVPPTLTSIAISGGTSVVAASTLQLTAAPLDQNGNPIAATVTWSSGATGIATVSSTGLVTGVAAGSAVISAASGSVSATVTITVAAQVLTSITVSGGSTVVAGSTLQLIAAARDQNGKAMTGVFTWASDATAVATVNSSGLVSGVAAGSAHITASSGAVNGTATITVTAAAVFPSNVDVNATATNSFTPATIDIAVNGTVNWIFAGVTHNVTFSGSGPTGGNISNTSNATVSRAFSVAGTFNYQCTLHGGMTGQVIVH